ncbi:MAG: hypothetical protein IRZ00_03050 [Gemmatimonadetes bacterium]|nr:hypothetical protein [Gemmatimonadota bacterium]
MRHLESLTRPPHGSPATACGARPRPRLGTNGLAWAVALLATATLLAGCNGDNVFANPDSGGPVVTDIALPPTVRVGDTLVVRLTAAGPRGVAGFSVSLRGAVVRDTVVQVTPAKSVVREVQFALPAVFEPSTSLVVQASAIDPAGVTGKLTTASISGVVVPPSVVELQAPDSVRPGSPLTLTAVAVGFKPIKGLVVRFQGAFQSVVSVPVSTADTAVRPSFQVQVPTTVEDSTLLVDVQAVDETGAVGGATRWALPVVVPRPEITEFWIRQDSVRAGGVLDLHVEARGLRQVQHFNIYLRGGVQVESLVIPAAPPRVHVEQDIPVPVPAGMRGIPISVLIVAVDGAGRLSNERVDSATVVLDDPVITNLIVSNTVWPCGTLDARVEAHSISPRRLVRVELSLRQAFEADVSAAVDPQRTYVTQDIAVPLTTDMYRSGFASLLVFAKVVDESGAVSPIDSAWVPVVPSPDTACTGSTAGGPAVSLSVSGLGDAPDVAGSLGDARDRPRLARAAVAARPAIRGPAPPIAAAAADAAIPDPPEQRREWAWEGGQIPRGGIYTSEV